MSYNITVEPSVEPVSVAEVREHLRNEGESFDDDYITHLIKVSRKLCEKYCNRVFITQTWQQNESSFGAYIDLAVNKVQSVTSITYVDTAEAEQTLSTSNYQVDLLADTATVYEGVTAGFPAISSSTINPIKITYVCGYGVASAVPDDIKQAIFIMISNFYENREGVVVPVGGFVNQIPMPRQVRDILGFYRVNHFG
jgi:uncharacterized phiE125 gp8 family phage protein|tara:strand:- start:3351 stop:3941 length:591 start_codon:yes stop_codon:yes gene_type:complete